MTSDSPVSSKLVKQVSELISQFTGIQLGAKQQPMVESRLQRRMSELGIREQDDYLDYIKENISDEINVLISLVTTHHTFFFREYVHFEFLEKRGLKEIIANLRAQKRKTLRVWSAACSRGQEVYSLSIFLKGYLAKHAPDIQYEILGNDVDPSSIEYARNGVYKWDEVKEVPKAHFDGNLQRGTGDISNFVKVLKPIKAPCKFETMNLLTTSESMGDRSFDIIFCRNVFIYFSPKQIEFITEQLLRHLDPAGYLFLGISENLNGIPVAVQSYSHSVYSRIRAVPDDNQLQQKQNLIRVICVDDSPTILSLLAKILSKEAGFEVVSTASDPVEARVLLQKRQADVMTLDIHMPIESGIDYLRKSYHSDHIPVMMITSVNRDDIEIAQEAIRLGASDYVEKPTFQNFIVRGEEIRSKLRTLVSKRKQSPLKRVG